MLSEATENHFNVSVVCILYDYCQVSFSMSAELGEMSKKNNPLVFLDVSIDGNPLERITIEVIPWPFFFYTVAISFFCSHLLS